MKIGQIHDGHDRKLILSRDGDVWKDASRYISWENAIDLTIESLNRFDGEDFDQMPVILVKNGFSQPIPTPGKIVCVGLNYAAHSNEVGLDNPQEPLLFLKSPTSICGPNQKVVMPDWASKLDWEIELGIVMGRRAKSVTIEQARDCVLGFVVANDLSDRGAQLDRGGQWTKGKSADGFCPVGPYLVTFGEGESIDDLELELTVNGVTRQRARVRDMLFSPTQLIEYISSFMTLEPGDLVITGTPHGCSIGQPDLPFLEVGDIVSAKISGLGEQQVEIVNG